MAHSVQAHPKIETGCSRQIEPTILVTFHSSNTVQVGQLGNPMMIWDTLVCRWEK